MGKICWEPTGLKEKTPYNDLIETFIQEYLFGQNQIFPKPNPFLVKLAIADSVYLQGESKTNLSPSFEEIFLTGGSGYPSDVDAGIIKLYNLRVDGKTTSKLCGCDNKIGIGNITIVQVFIPETGQMLLVPKK